MTYLETRQVNSVATSGQVSTNSAERRMLQALIVSASASSGVTVTLNGGPSFPVYVSGAGTVVIPLQGVPYRTVDFAWISGDVTLAVVHNPPA